MNHFGLTQSGPSNRMPCIVRLHLKASSLSNGEHLEWELSSDVVLRMKSILWTLYYQPWHDSFKVELELAEPANGQSLTRWWYENQSKLFDANRSQLAVSPCPSVRSNWRNLAKNKFGQDKQAKDQYWAYARATMAIFAGSFIKLWCADLSFDGLLLSVLNVALKTCITFINLAWTKIRTTQRAELKGFKRSNQTVCLEEVQLELVQ